ncbi:hypothetical protein BASA50_007554 [Batrachochytrium salamandrivorans]|uniref:Uncharacterized protein n=1 Tax=Batrachochytrium salamandrivorans TaxID=1357716 RepID=A0ABQ8F738_9FUNG|nr:hypothetical protein BASA50_007554 [Batrachochytrium salamandrivorans]
MKTAAILVISLLAIIGGAAPAPALNGDDLQLYKRQVLPPALPPPSASSLLKDSEQTPQNDWRRRLKDMFLKKETPIKNPFGEPQSRATLQHRKPLGDNPFGEPQSRASLPYRKLLEAVHLEHHNPMPHSGFRKFLETAFVLIQKGYGSEFYQKPTIVGNSKAGIPVAPPLPPSNSGGNSVNWRETVNTDGSKKSSPAPSIPKTKPQLGFKPSDSDLDKARLKRVGQNPKPDLAPEPFFSRIQLRQTFYRGGPKVIGHRIQSGLVPAIQKSRLRLLGRALDPGVENVYTWLRGGVLNGEADLDQRWLDGTVEHESMGTRHDNRALAARLADFLQVAYRQYQSTLWKYHRDRLVEVG